MNLVEQNYRPKNIEFNVAPDGSLMPPTFGNFESEKELFDFINFNLIAVPFGITVNRHMDNFEKTELRKEYNDILENILPVYEKRLSEAIFKLEEAKKNLKNAQELVNSSITKTREIAMDVKRGMKEMNLDEQFTFRVAYKSRYYIYTYIDKELKLCAIRDIPESEKTEVWNSMSKNEQFIDDNFSSAKDEYVSEQNNDVIERGIEGGYSDSADLLDEKQ